MATARLAGHRCFGPDVEALDLGVPMTLIIGRNNAGKSTLLDILARICKVPDGMRKTHPGSSDPREIELCDALNVDELQSEFRPGSSGGPIRGDHFKFAEQWIGKHLTWLRVGKDDAKNVSVEPAFEPNLRHKFEQIAKRKRLDIEDRSLRRLHAERDVVPEPDGDLLVLADGGGTTTLLQHVLNKAKYSSDLVEVELLSQLNAVLSPDNAFTRIDVRQYADGRWELYLQEDGKGLIPLSHSGSGIKTVLLTLVQLVVVPEIIGPTLAKTTFAFEELENGLHPALQRRLFRHIRNIVVKNNSQVFLTTHSPVVIDMFASDAKSQLLHVTHNGKVANLARVSTHLQKCSILEDLEVRASDLLQANAVIWVEGPSDRVYVRRWIELWSKGELVEGTHYQCVFYGGRLLAHLSAESDAGAVDEALAILRVNRNAVMLLDSDRQSLADDINDTKKRLITEMAGVGGMEWVSAGREIENYLPLDAVKAVYPGVASQSRFCEQFERFFSYLAMTDEKAAKRYSKEKSAFAHLVAPYLTRANLSPILDLDAKIGDLVSRLKRWNALA